MQNLSKINKLFKNKTILITGGTGSFGSKFIQKILSVDCKIVIFSRDELKQYEQRIDYNKKNIEIKENTVVGAHSLVLKNCKKNSTYFGNPAKFKFNRTLKKKYI